MITTVKFVPFTEGHSIYKIYKTFIIEECITEDYCSVTVKVQVEESAKKFIEVISTLGGISIGDDVFTGKAYRKDGDTSNVTEGYDIASHKALTKAYHYINKCMTAIGNTMKDYSTPFLYASDKYRIKRNKQMLCVHTIVENQKKNEG